VPARVVAPAPAVVMSAICCLHRPRLRFRRRLKVTRYEYVQAGPVLRQVENRRAMTDGSVRYLSEGPPLYVQVDGLVQHLAPDTPILLS